MVINHTPWGTPDRKKEIAPGIYCVSTPSHGGYVLSDERLAAMPAVLRTPSNFYEKNSRFFEEDCECRRVHLAWPHLFPNVDQKRAELSFENYHKDIMADWVAQGRPRGI